MVILKNKTLENMLERITKLEQEVKTLEEQIKDVKEKSLKSVNKLVKENQNATNVFKEWLYGEDKRKE